MGTLATPPEKVDQITATLDRIWWDRPFTVTDVKIGAGEATVGVRTSYGVDQQIDLRTDDAGMVDRLDVALRPPKIGTWSDIDAELTKSGARYSYQFSKVAGDNARCDVVAGTNTDLSLPLARSSSSTCCWRSPTR